MIEYLKWDSEFFKAKIGKVYGLKDMDALLHQKEAQQYDRIYVFSESKIEYLHPNLLLVDEKAIFERSVSPANESPQFTHVYEGDNSPELIELAILSGHKSRFKTDTFFAPHYERLYQEWLNNSLNKTYASEVLTACIDDTIVGFVTLSKQNKHGNIGLIAVNNRHQDQGIGKDLLIASNHWYQQNSVTCCSVATQLSNQGACRLYQSFGYQLKKIQYIYHI